MPLNWECLLLLEALPTISVLEVVVLVVHHVLLVERLPDLVLTVISAFTCSITVTSAVSHIVIFSVRLIIN